MSNPALFVCLSFYVSLISFSLNVKTKFLAGKTILMFVDIRKILMFVDIRKI